MRSYGTRCCRCIAVLDSNEEMQRPHVRLVELHVTKRCFRQLLLCVAEAAECLHEVTDLADLAF